MSAVERRPDRLMDGPNADFWAFCNEEKLCLQRCLACAELAWPVTGTCLSCGGREFEWLRCSGNGTVVSWCTFERNYYVDVLPVPWECILVELEEGPLFISNPHGFATPDFAPALRVRLVFRECEDRWGPFKLPVFEQTTDSDYGTPELP